MKRTVALVCVAVTASACGGGDDASPFVTVPPVTESTNDQTTDDHLDRAVDPADNQRAGKYCARDRAR